MGQNRVRYFVLVCLTLAAAYGCYLLFAPFLRPALSAAVAAVLFQPVYSRLRRWLKSRTVAALLTTAVVILLLIASMLLLGRALAVGVHEIYEALNPAGDGKERLGVFLLHLSEQIAEALRKAFPSVDVHSAVTDQAQKTVAAIVNFMASTIAGVAVSLANALISVFVLFFAFRDGRNLIRRAYVLFPLRIDQTRRLFVRIEDTLRAIVYGTLAIAAIQGLLTGLGFWILGVTSPILWGIITALCALVPVIGTGFVLVPAICMLASNGHWIKALILLVWGLIVVHPIDNVLRPYLIGKQTQLSTLFVFFSIVGGLRMFGTLGIFLGPVMLAVALALFQIVREESRAGPDPPRGTKKAPVWRAA